MAIPLECINIVIPISALSKCSALGNIEDFLSERVSPGSGRWHDEYLYREGAMNQLDVKLRLDEWKKIGLRPTKKVSGEMVWNEVCVVDSFSGPTLPCSWLVYDPEEQTVRYIGQSE